MVGLDENFGPASETYAGFAWDYLRRNKGYCENCLTIPQSPEGEFTHPGIGIVKFGIDNDKKAHKWGLECFASPDEDALKAMVVWRQDAFPGALSVQYHAEGGSGDGGEMFKLSNFECHKQHYIKTDGTRISVLKSARFWLQISGKPSNVEIENQPFSVLIHGGPGARRRIDALRQLTSLNRDGIDEFRLLGRQKAFSKMRNALLAYDIKACGGSYKDIATALFGAAKVTEEWDPTGCFLKSRALRAYKFGERMVAQDYQSLLPKKTL